MFFAGDLQEEASLTASNEQDRYQELGAPTHLSLGVGTGYVRLSLKPFLLYHSDVD